MSDCEELTGGLLTGENSGVAEGESSTSADIIEEINNLAKFTTKFTTKCSS